MQHVEDTKVSHMHKAVVKQACDVLESKFGSMKVIIGKEHYFLWSRITHRDDRRFEIDTSRYLSYIVDEFVENPTEALMLVRSGIFDVDF